jgi:hypothetical protein
VDDAQRAQARCDRNNNANSGQRQTD